MKVLDALVVGWLLDLVGSRGDVRSRQRVSARSRGRGECEQRDADDSGVKTTTHVGSDPG
jgi:hypothetical protein